MGTLEVISADPTIHSVQFLVFAGGMTTLSD